MVKMGRKKRLTGQYRGLEIQDQVAPDQGKLVPAKIRRVLERKRPEKRPETDPVVTEQKEYAGQSMTGEPLYAYAGVAGRLWLGEPHKSSWVSASGLAYKPIHQSQLAEAEEAAKADLRQRLGQLYREQTGLEASDDNIRRIEWLVLWDADGTMLRRIEFFENARRTPVLSSSQIRGLDQEGIKKIIRDWNPAGGASPELGKLILPPGTQWEKAPEYPEIPE